MLGVAQLPQRTPPSWSASQLDSRDKSRVVTNPGKNPAITFKNRDSRQKTNSLSLFFDFSGLRISREILTT